MKIETNVLTAEVFLNLYGSVGWEPPLAAQVETALKNSLATFTAYDGETAVGMVRLLGDGGVSFYMKDFCVRPSYQGKGVGTMLFDAVERFVRAHVSPEWTVSLELISSKTAVPFYKRKGFEEMPCDLDGPGMMKMLRPLNEKR